MNICLFTAHEIQQPLALRDYRAQHILKILRKAVGDTFAAGVIGGQAGTATITAIETHSAHSADGRKTFAEGALHFTFVPLSDGKPLFPLRMVVGFPRPIQLKRLLRDMAGLGVQELHLTGTELGEKSYLRSTMATTDAGQQMLREGAEQAGSTHIPLLRLHPTLAECLESLAPAADGSRPALLALDNVQPADSLGRHLALHPCGCAVAAIGSERGWTNAERALLEQSGYTRLGMGTRILRTESAATVAASLILNSMGALG